MSSSSSVPAKPGPAIAETIEEVQAVMPSAAALEDAIARLTQAGFDRADLSLPTANPAASEATPEQGASLPTTDTDRRQARTLGTSMAMTGGAFVAAGLTVATGGAAAVAAAAAAAAGLGAGALAGAASTGANQADEAARTDAAARGELVLAVRIAAPGRQALAEAALRQAGATRVVPLERATAAVDSAGWTGA